MLQNTTEGTLKKTIKSYYKTKKSFIHKKVFDFFGYNNFLIKSVNSIVPYELLGERDFYMKNELEALLLLNPNKKIVHVGGMAHIINNKSNPEITLASFFPKSKTYSLNQADVL
ncbi:MAG: hypothetical protein AABX88_02995 [Nanoarchaeota archaeon]